VETRTDEAAVREDDTEPELLGDAEGQLHDIVAVITLAVKEANPL
jgi:hypothetical protein